MTKRKKKQSPTRNADTEFINKQRQANEAARSSRSLMIRDRERRARERARTELEAALRSSHV